MVPYSEVKCLITAAVFKDNAIVYASREARNKRGCGTCFWTMSENAYTLRPLLRPNRPFKGWLRSRAYREARRLLDEEYKRYSQGQSRPAEDHLPPLPSSSPPAPPANQAKLIPPPPRTPSPPQLPPSLYLLLPPPRTPSPAFSDALTERIFPDTSPQLSESSHPPPRSYFRILESDTFESLLIPAGYNRIHPSGGLHNRPSLFRSSGNPQCHHWSSLNLQDPRIPSEFHPCNPSSSQILQ
ncbi:hypothetical protein ALC56_13031 [Trachymyrmex septentrionalis]|uniref:Uncharacterized protein n=1 Tax=Trachymyrmex septentrionalis TaxID=34720 RepID=A0A195EW98_9HYME|nr:hypothetical protein ALC56_13031 [Trachymyrmex septentrionalis]